jgi:hypothetical protein
MQSLQRGAGSNGAVSPRTVMINKGLPSRVVAPSTCAAERLTRQVRHLSELVAYVHMLACAKHVRLITIHNAVLQGQSTRHLVSLAATPKQQHPVSQEEQQGLGSKLAATALAAVLSITSAAGSTAPLLPFSLSPAHAEQMLLAKRDTAGATATAPPVGAPVEPAILDAPVDRMVEPPALKQRDDLTPEELRSIRIFQDNTPSVSG